MAPKCPMTPRTEAAWRAALLENQNSTKFETAAGRSEAGGWADRLGGWPDEPTNFLH